MTATAAPQSATPGVAKAAKPKPILELKNVGISYMVRAGEQSTADFAAYTGTNG